jgi:adenylate cyclase
MIKPQIPFNETDRINALNSYLVLDTLPEKDYDEITKIAAEICQTPISLVSLIDQSRQWFKSHHGLNATETSRDIAFCAHAINQPGELMIIPDSTKDERFLDNPLVTADPNVIFYAGIPLKNPQGYALGTLCVIDHKPRELSERQQESLKALGNQVVNLLELRKANYDLILSKNEIEKSHKESEKLLLNILPLETARELKKNGFVKAKNYDLVSVLFTDFCGFSKIAERLSPEELVKEIDFCYKNFDAIIEHNSIEKIKTIGDSYMAAGGIPLDNKSNPIDTVKAAVAIRNFMLKHKMMREAAGKAAFEARIGVHTGPVIAGVVGSKKYAYDIWGDTVNIASRLESSGEAGKVNISGDTYALIKNEFYCEYRGKVTVKNKGEIDMYFVK